MEMSANAKAVFIRNIFFDILFTILSCGLYNIYIQYKQIEAVNVILGKTKYTFLRWSIFSLLTCGLYHIYHEYLMSRDILEANRKNNSIELIAHVVFSLVGLTIITDALQQNEINNYFGQKNI